MTRILPFLAGQPLHWGVIRKIGSGVVVRVMAVAGGLASSVVLARMLGPEDYGTYAFVFAIVALFALPVQMGLPTLIVRETATAATLKDWALMRGIWNWSGKIICSASALIVILVSGALLLFPQILVEDRREALLWGVWMIPFMALAVAREAALRGLKAIFFSGLPDQVVRPVLLAVFVLVAGAVLNLRLSATVTMQLALVASMIAFLLGARLLFRARPPELAQEKAITTKPREWLKVIAPFSLIAGVQLIRENTDILMLGIWYGDADVGLYRIALSIGTLVVFGLVAINMVAQPYIVAAHATGDRQRLQTIAGGVAALSFAAALVIALVIWLEGERVISLLYGGAYADAYLPLAILAAGSLIHAFFGMAGGVLALTGNERTFLWVSIFAVVLNIAGNALLIPSFGNMGAAVATAGSLAIGEILKYACARRTLQIDASPLALLRFLRRG